MTTAIENRPPGVTLNQQPAVKISPSDKRHLWVAVIAGGQGTRLFPFSHEGCPKQFCQLDEENTFVQATVKRFLDYGVKPDHIIVATSTESQTRLAQAQLAPLGLTEQTNFYLVNPAYGYAGSMVKVSEFIEHLDLEAVVINTPADQHIVADGHFAQAINTAYHSARGGHPTIVGVKVNDLVTATGCGHAIYNPFSFGPTMPVVDFVEKPNEEIARQLLADNHSVVNTGINVWLASQIGAVTKSLPLGERQALTTNALMKRFGDKLHVAIGQFQWYDCGTLKSLYDISRKTPNHRNATLGRGQVRRGRYCRGSLFIATAGTHILAHAAQDVAVVTSQIEGRFVLTVVSLADSQRVRALAEKYRENKTMLTNDFSLDARNNIVVETEISHEVHFAFVGVDNYVVTPLSGPDDTILFSVSNNIPVESLDLV